jgi:hypothetical protein
MGQIFSPAGDTWLRLFLVGVVSLAVGSVVFAIGLAHSDWITGAATHPPAQPVPFSHRHHAGELGIDCRYCHTSVADSPRAGLPPTHTCMTCHSQIWTGAPILAPVRDSLAQDKPIVWRRVSGLPDYVYFNHQIHVGRGVACVECHGRIDKMPMTYRGEAFKMRFCLGCHRNPEPRLKPPDQVTRMDWSGWTAQDQARFGPKAMAAYHLDPKRMTDCSLCHR